MAGIDPRTSITGAHALQPAPSRVQAAREIQRAFFNAALSGEPATTPASPPSTGRTPPTDGARPDRPLRPGSLLDIKV